MFSAAQFIMDLIDDQCQPSSTLKKAQEDSEATKLIIALKALGNLGHVAQKVDESSESGRTALRIEDKIAKCMAENKTPDNVTVAAIHAFRRFVPNQKISEHLLAVLADETESSEGDFLLRFSVFFFLYSYPLDSLFDWLIYLFIDR